MSKKTIGIFFEVLVYTLQSSIKEVKTSTLYDLQELSSLFVHYYKGDVLEDFPGLVDLTIKWNLNDKHRGALSKLQHFIGNRMSRDIMMLVLGDPVEWMLGCSIGSKYLGSSLDASLYESYTRSPKIRLLISNITSNSS